MYDWANLQSVHGFRCYDNIHACQLIVLYTANANSAEREMSASACSRCMPGSHKQDVLTCSAISLRSKSRMDTELFL